MAGFWDTVTNTVGSLVGAENSTTGDSSWLDIVKAVAPSVIKGIGQQQSDNSVNSALEDAINKIKEREEAQYQAQLADLPNQQAALDARAAAARQAQAFQQAYYEKAQKMLSPFADAARAEIPIRANIYKQGMGSLSEALAKAATQLNGPRTTW
jgi:hypothetical protein